MSLIKELNRRNVFRVGVAYLIVAWLLLQVADVILPTFKTPDWVMQAFTLLLILGFPLALIFAWAFELTPEGLKKEKDVDRSRSITHVTGRKLDFAIIAVLAVALVFFASTHQWGSETGNAEIADQSIAVLAFVNMSDDPGNEYFSEGLSEELRNLLAKIPELRVAARTSSFSYKGKDVKIAQIGEELNVAHVLEGSVRKAGNHVRITAQLVKVDDGFHLWSETFDRTLDDIFAIQDEIAAAVVDSLKITLLGKEPKATKTNPEAYALYLQGRYFISQFTAEGNKQAETLLKQALAIDSDFAPAWTDLGRVYGDQAGVFGLRPIDEGYELARDAIQQALDIDPQYARAYAALASVKMSYDFDFKAAFQHLQQALALNPGDAAILNFAARLNEVLGRIDEAIDLHRQSIALDPLSPRAHIDLGGTYYWAHRLDEAAESLQLALSLNPGLVGAQYSLGRVLLAQWDAPAALVAIEQETGDVYRVTGTAIAQHALGDAGASDAALEELIEKYAAAGAYQVAEVYAFRGEIDYAFDWLEQAYDNRDPGLPQMLGDPLLANLYDDPRWEPLLDKMGLPH